MPSKNTLAQPQGAKLDNCATAHNDEQTAIEPQQYIWGGTAKTVATRAVQPALWASIPQGLRERPQWCLADPDKRPKAADGSYASSTNPATWTDFDAACAAASQRGWHVGYMLHEDDPYTCIDLDIKSDAPPDFIQHCKDIIATFDSYTEHSLSGIGYHIWVEGDIGAGRKGGGCEIYSKERFIVCTGNVVNQKPIEDRDHLAKQYADMIGGKETEFQELPDAPAVEADGAILQKAFAAANSAKIKAHYNGDWKEIGHTDHSRADQSLLQMLAHYTPNNEQLTRLFLGSALGQRDKLKRKDYLPRTIAHVRTMQAADSFRNSQHIEHGRQMAAALLENFDRKHGHSKSNGSRLPSTAPTDTLEVNIKEAGEVTLEYLDNPWIPNRQAIGFYGRGESGKSSAAATFCARNGHRYSTLWITSEEAEDHIKKRHERLGGHPGTMGTVSKADFDVYTHLELSIAQAKAKLAKPLGFVVLDSISALVTWGKGESPNDEASVKRLVGHIDRLAQDEGVAILMIGHMNKNKGHEHITDTVSGSLAWTSSTRLSYILQKVPEQDYVGFIRTAKSNLGAHFGSFYHTVPVHQMEPNIDGFRASLCGIEFDGQRIYGEHKLRMAMIEDDDPIINRMDEKQKKLDAAVKIALDELKDGTPKTRSDLEARFNQLKISRRLWLALDSELSSKNVLITNGQFNMKHYQLCGSVVHAHPLPKTLNNCTTSTTESR